MCFVISNPIFLGRIILYTVVQLGTAYKFMDYRFPVRYFLEIQPMTSCCIVAYLLFQELWQNAALKIALFGKNIMLG